jgi:CBS domain-containing protein
MRVSEVMSRNVQMVHWDQPVRDATRMMAELNAGFLPVRDGGNKMVGIVTDRDIALRVVSAGKYPDTLVRDVMTRNVRYCFEDAELTDAAKDMANHKLRRLAVLNRDNRLVGVITLGDLARHEIVAAAVAVTGVSVPGGPNC